MITTLQKGLGDEFDKATQVAWLETYTIIANVMRQAAYPEFDPALYENNKEYAY